MIFPTSSEKNHVARLVCKEWFLQLVSCQLLLGKPWGSHGFWSPASFPSPRKLRDLKGSGQVQSHRNSNWASLILFSLVAQLHHRAIHLAQPIPITQDPNSAIKAGCRTISEATREDGNPDSHCYLHGNWFKPSAEGCPGCTTSLCTADISRSVIFSLLNSMRKPTGTDLFCRAKLRGICSSDSL